MTVTTVSARSKSPKAKSTRMRPNPIQKRGPAKYLVMEMDGEQAVECRGVEWRIYDNLEDAEMLASMWTGPDGPGTPFNVFEVRPVAMYVGGIPVIPRPSKKVI